MVAGVLGTRKLAYDVWGDTVNTASRTESCGDPGRVNITAATYDRVRELFVCEPRGRVVARHKGEIPMYFVHSIRSELSVDGAGLEPTARFWETLMRGEPRTGKT